jgi:predicted Zn-dependent protease
MSARRSTVLGALVLAALLAGLGCSLLQNPEETVTKVKNSPITKVAVSVRNSLADITDEEEYYIGRSVSALILARYPVYDNDVVTQYVNKVGLAVAAYSDRPETYAGYHFLVLDTPEINAFAAPGGFVFVTRGLIGQCRDEEMLAAVLAHEVGHVNARHGLKAIKQSRLMDTFKLIGSEAAKAYSPADLAQLTDLFQGVLSDIAGELIEKGYDRKLEYEADSLAIKFTRATGYNPSGLSDLLKNLAAASKKEAGKGWFQTHPTPQDRLDRVDRQILALKTVPVKFPLRTARFKQAMSFMK